MSRRDVRVHLEHHKLDAEHLRSLRSVQHRHLIDDKHATALIDGGYARPVIGGLMLTDLGRAMLAKELVRG